MDSTVRLVWRFASFSLCLLIACFASQAGHADARCNPYWDYTCGVVVPDFTAKWTAIALSPSTLSYGTSWQAGTQEEAFRLALSGCAKYAKDCRIVMSGLNKCLALAESRPDETWAADFDTNGARAQQKAIAGCHARGGKSCKVEADPCSHD